jgi:hypothetical protein
MNRSVPPALPMKREVRLAYASSVVVSLAVTVVSVAGLLWGSDGRYRVGSPLVQVSQGGDAANLIIGLPALLVAMRLARRGYLIGLLLWPGALFYVLYTYALYLVGGPFDLLFFGYVALVTLSGWSLISIVASIDGEEVRRRLAVTTARSVGGALVVIAMLAYAGLTAAAVSSLGSPANAVGMRPQWVVDYALGTPALLLGGALLWRRAPLGYVVGPGLLLVSGLNGLAFSASAVLDSLLAGRSIESAVVVVHLGISGVSFALLAVFGHDAYPAGRPMVDVIKSESRRRRGAGAEMR